MDHLILLLPHSISDLEGVLGHQNSRFKLPMCSANGGSGLFTMVAAVATIAS